MTRGQISIFVMFVLVIFISVFFVFYTKEISRNGFEDKSKETISTKNNIESFADSCHKKVLQDALGKLGQNGGYIYYTPEIKIQYTEDYQITFLFIDRKSFLPEKEKIEDDIERYINENIGYCLDAFVIYEQQGWNVTLVNATSDVKIVENDVTAITHFPSGFSSGKVSFKINRLISTSKTPIDKILRVVKSILEDAREKQVKADSGGNPEFPPNEYAKNGLFFINYRYPDSSRLLWKLKDEKYQFFFAVNIET